jgi:hypothetical protein
MIFFLKVAPPPPEPKPKTTRGKIDSITLSRAENHRYQNRPAAEIEGGDE